MINQANGHGISIDNNLVSRNGWDTVTNPVLHDSSTNLVNSAPSGGPAASSVDRDVIYTNGTKVRERKATSGTMSYADTATFITYKVDPLTADHISGTVDAKTYVKWLNDHGYDLQNVVVN